jgi:hypothetical protein
MICFRFQVGAGRQSGKRGRACAEAGALSSSCLCLDFSMSSNSCRAAQ